MSSNAASYAGSPVDGQSIAATNEPVRNSAVGLGPSSSWMPPTGTGRDTNLGGLLRRASPARDLAVPTRRDEHRRLREDAGAHRLDERADEPTVERTVAAGDDLAAAEATTLNADPRVLCREPRRRDDERPVGATLRRAEERACVRRMHRITALTVSDSVILPAQGSRPLRGFRP
jgi:hypothetical protein